MPNEYYKYVEPLALYIPTLEPTESILSTIAPSILSNSVEIVERMEWTTIVQITVATSIAISSLTTICVLGASIYCNRLRSYFRHKYLNSIASDSDSSEDSREDSVVSSLTMSSNKSSRLDESSSSQLERFIWAHFTFDKIYAREDDDIV